ncbi:Endo-1-4-beta-xylanase D [Pyrenophora teres f. maculata]|nr:Endo-1-4-beta-xylanase D [Pyrenophora teres f. maculata]
MHFNSILLVAAINIGFAAAGQVNFYSDKNCQNYIGESHPGINQIAGGPAGGFSALWVNADLWSCSQSCGPYWICGDSGCNNKVSTVPGRCVSFNSGVWAVNKCQFC